MRIEHIGLQHPDPAAAAEWYVEHLGFRVLRSGPPPADARFLADGAGATVLEIYHNPAVPMPDYAAMDPLVLHIAVCVDDVAAAHARLLAAGAARATDITRTEAGDEFAIVRDPWGLPLQLMHRAKPLA